MEYFTDALKNYANFSGSATRQQYWMFILFYVIFYICCAVIDGLLGMAALETIFSIALLIPSISITTRRLHDIGKSGWWQLIVLVPIIGGLVLLYFVCQPSAASNQYE